MIDSEFTPGIPQPGTSNPSPDDAPSSNQDVMIAAKGGGISFVGRVFEYAMRFVFGILIARVIGVELYGHYTLGITVAMIASNFAMLGLQVGLVRFLPSAIREKDEPAMWGILQVCIGFPVLFSLVLAVCLFLLAEPLANLVFHDLRLVPALRIVSLLIPLDTLAFMAYVITISFKQPKYSVIANNIIAPLAKLVLAAGFLAAGLSTNGVLVAQVIASVAAVLVLLYFVNALVPLKRLIEPSRRNTWQLMKYSFPAYLGWIVNTIRTSLSTMVLGIVGLPAGVGVFTAASRFGLIGSMFYLSVGNISTPIIADLHSRGKTAQIKAYYQTTTRWLVMFNLPIFLTSVLFAQPLLWIFGDDFTTGTTSMMILACGTLVYTCTGLGANILDMTDHPKVNTANSVIMVLVTIGLNLLLIPRFGVIGAATATALSTAVVNLICMVEVWYLLHMLPYNRSFIKPILSSLAAGILTLIFLQLLMPSPLLQLILGGTFLWGIYIISLIVLRFTAEDLSVITQIRDRLLMGHNIQEQQARKIS